MEFLLDTALAVAQNFAHDEDAEQHLIALVTPEVQRSTDRYQFVNALVPGPEGVGVIKICLHEDKSIAWDTRHVSRQEVAKIAERERRVARMRAAFLTTVLRGLRGCGSSQRA